MLAWKLGRIRRGDGIGYWLIGRMDDATPITTARTHDEIVRRGRELLDSLSSKRTAAEGGTLPRFSGSSPSDPNPDPTHASRSRRSRRGCLPVTWSSESRASRGGKVRRVPPCLRGSPLTRPPCSGRCAPPACCASTPARTRRPRPDRVQPLPTTGRRVGDARNHDAEHSRCRHRDG